MKTPAICLAILLCWVAPAWAQGPIIRPGTMEAEKAERQPKVPPLYSPHPKPLDPAKLKSEAEELTQLAASIPADVDRASKGLLPTDLNARLKRIEKLAKQLRRELTP